MGPQVCDRFLEELIPISEEFKFNYKNYKTHKFKSLNRIHHYDNRFKYYKCDNCGIIAVIHKRIFKNETYTKTDYSCDEMIIKNIIE